MSSNDDQLPVMFHHCRNVYDTMLSQATKVNGLVVYEGHLTRLITKQLHLSVPYYTSITRELKRMGCIRQLRRGGGSAPSQWELVSEPTEDLFRDAVASRTQPQTRTDMLEQQVRSLTQRVNHLEDALSLASAATPDEQEAV